MVGLTVSIPFPNPTSYNVIHQFGSIVTSHRYVPAPPRAQPPIRQGCDVGRVIYNEVQESANNLGCDIKYPSIYSFDTVLDASH